MAGQRSRLVRLAGPRMSKSRNVDSFPDGYKVLSSGELRGLLQDEEQMNQIVRLSGKFQELEMERETLLASNRSLAEASLSQRPSLRNGKLLLAAKYERLAKFSTACREKQFQLEALTEQHSPQTAHGLLQGEVVRAEEKSEELLEKFMEGRVPLDEFLESFQNQRKTYHIRRAQAEKLQELNRPDCDRKPEEEEEEKREEERKDWPCNDTSPPGPLRLFQLRYGLTPAILLPLSSSSAQGRPSLDSGLLQASVPGSPVSLRVIGQLPGWPVRPVRLHQLYKPPQSEPACR